jgi:hypothetical protein
VENYHPMRIDHIDKLGAHLQEIVQELSQRPDSRWNRDTNQALIASMKELNPYIDEWGFPHT